MTYKEVCNLVEGSVLCGEEFLNEEVEYGYSCDLMSDVLAFVQNQVLLITGLIHPQVIRTAEMLDIKAILLVRGKKPSEKLIEMAKEGEILLILSKHSLFSASGRLFKAGLKGEEIAHEL